MAMKILVVGGGGREHAIVRALARNPGTDIVSVMAKRNPGIAALARDFRLCRETDIPRIVAYARETGVEYAFIGPEAPLEAGIVDQLEGHRHQSAWGRPGQRHASRPTRRSAGT